jgi:hypothetical protein
MGIPSSEFQNKSFQARDCVDQRSSIDALRALAKLSSQADPIKIPTISRYLPNASTSAMGMWRNAEIGQNNFGIVTPDPQSLELPREPEIARHREKKK